jgi:hypothetical protein
MDERTERKMSLEGAATRRTIAKGAAAGSLAALFAAVGSGRVMAHDGADDTVDTTDDYGAVVAPTGGRRSKGTKLQKSGKRGKGKH